MEPSWIRDVFVDKADLMLKVLNRRWPQAEQTVEGIVKVLGEHGIKSGRVLDLCCGNGRFSIYLAKKGFEVVGIDFSGRFINDAREKAIEHGVSDLTRFL